MPETEKSCKVFLQRLRNEGQTARRAAFTCLAQLAGKTRRKACTHGYRSSTLEIVGKWVYFAVSVVVIGVIAYFVYVHRAWLGLGSAGGGVPTEETNTDLEPAHVSWHAVDRTQDGFRIDMPSDTSEIQIPAYNVKGGAEEMEMIVATPNAETTYAIAWDDNPPVERASGEAVERTLDNARDGALARTQTTLMGESHANYLGYPGRDFSGHNQSGGLFNARLILKGTKLYMMIAAFPAPSARRDEDVNHFFDSFKLTSGAHGE
jgi:hypothetical protein